MLHRQQVEVHLGRIGLVLAHAIQEDGHARRQSHDGAHVEAARAEVQLEGGAEVIIERDAGLGGERVGQQPRLPGIDRLARHGRDAGRDPGADQGSSGGSDRAGNLDRLELRDPRGVPAGAIGLLGSAR